MSLKNSAFGKRVRPRHAESGHAEDEPNKRQRINPIFDTSPTPSTSTTQVAASPSPAYGDRFVPRRDSGDLRVGYHLRDENDPIPKQKSRIIQPESDALKEQANTLFTSVLHTEVDVTSRPSSPVRPPPPQASSSKDPATPSTPTRGRTRLFSYTSPSTPPRRQSTSPQRPGLDSPNHPNYSLSPVRPASQSLLSSPRRQLRSVCKTPYRVLDAPELAEDFYLNLVDWSSTNVLGVGLGSCVYLWSARDAGVSKLCDVSVGDGNSSDMVSSVAWVQKGSVLAVATISGQLHIYDAPSLTLIRSYPTAHNQRIGALAWNGQVLSSGSRDRSIHHRDVREDSQRPWKKSTGHRQEVCGLKWSGANGGGLASGGLGGGGDEGPFIASAYLASGGNDNKVCVWDLRGTSRATASNGRMPMSTLHSSSMARGGATPNTTTPINIHTAQYGTAGSSTSTPNGNSSSGNQSSPGSDSDASSDGSSPSPGDAPLWKFHDHTAAVKALAWDPHVPGILATGGGTQDKHIRFWNTQTGTLLSQLDTGSQVCNLTWSLTSHELVSTHGYSSTTAQNQICIWKYPTLDMVASLGGHTNRVLYLAMSPDGETIVTGAGDETLRFWNAFPRREMASDMSDILGGGASEGGGAERGGQLDWGKLIR